jgi:hypothetical protein
VRFARLKFRLTDKTFFAVRRTPAPFGVGAIDDTRIFLLLSVKGLTGSAFQHSVPLRSSPTAILLPAVMVGQVLSSCVRKYVSPVRFM